MDNVEIYQDLIFKTLHSARKLAFTDSGNDELQFVEDNGTIHRWYHETDCCESVWLDSIVGDLEDLVDTPILLAECVTRPMTEDEASDSGTWTFYKFATIKGSVDITWRGESNGYYSESVDYKIIRPGEEDE